MQNHFDFLSGKPLTVGEFSSLIKREQKRKKTEGISTLQLNCQNVQELAIVPPFRMKERHLQLPQTRYESRTQVITPRQKHENFLRKNQGREKRQNLIKKRLAYKTLGNQCYTQKSIPEKPKFTFLKRKGASCEPVCGLFNIKCQNCKPSLDCFNKRFETFLRENNLWILNQKKKEDEHDEEIKKQILENILNFYQNHGKDMRKFQLMEKQAMENIKNNMVKKMASFEYNKFKEQEMIHWFKKLKNEIHKEFLEKQQKKNEIRMHKTSSSQRWNEEKKQKNQIDRSYYLKKIFSKVHKSLENKKKKLEVKNKEIHEQKEKKEKKEKGFLKKSRRQSLNEKTIKNFLKMRNIQSQINRDLEDQEFLTFSTRKNNKIINFNTKSRYINDQSLLNDSEEELKNSFNYPPKKIQIINNLPLQNEFEEEQKSQEQLEEEIQEFDEDFEIKRRRRRRKGKIRKFIPPHLEENDLDTFRRKISFHKGLIFRVEKFLDDIDCSKLKVKGTDGAFTLSRKFKHLKEIQNCPQDTQQDFTVYKKMVQTQIQGKLKRQEFVKNEAENVENVEKIEKEEQLIRTEDILKGLHFYDLYEVEPMPIRFSQLENRNYIKGLLKQYSIPHEITKKEVKNISRVVLKEVEEEKKKDDVLVQMDLGVKVIEEKLKKSAKILQK